MLRRTVLIVLTLLPMAAFALTLDGARAQGLVGEDWTGYIAAVSPNPSKDVQALITEVNAKRRTAYEKGGWARARCSTRRRPARISGWKGSPGRRNRSQARTRSRTGLTSALSGNTTRSM